MIIERTYLIFEHCPLYYFINFRYKCSGFQGKRYLGLSRLFAFPVTVLPIFLIHKLIDIIFTKQRELSRQFVL